MTHQNIHSTFYDLYDYIKGDNDDFINEPAFMQKIEELVDIGLMETGELHDCTIYSARPGLKWPDFVHIDDPIKKAIVLQLIKNPDTFFILLNTQKGKMRQIALELKKWGQDKSKKPVAFVVVDNDKTLADQSADGVLKNFEDQPVKLFMLSSNSKTAFEEIRTYIDAYASDITEEGDISNYPMPIIALLSNNKQCEKMLKLIHHIHKKVSRYNSILRWGIIFDEADKTYPQLRDKPFPIEGENLTLKTFILDQPLAFYKKGFVTASDGDLLDDYPECANAHLYDVVISPEDELYYRALHHPESIVRRVVFTSKHTNNSYATEILEKNSEHFMTPITLSTGEIYFRKIIMNSNSKIDQMYTFAKKCITLNMYAITFNGNGLKLFREGFPVESYKIKGKRLNEVLMYLYKKCNLHDKPFIILGRRKVDRGLGFHYCRTFDELKIEVPFGEPITLHNSEGLVFTDIILGRIEDKPTAIQKAGRGAGIIANSPQYPGNIYYWTDEYTEQLVRRHNEIVDKANDQIGCSVLQAVTRAESMTPEIQVNHRVEENTFLVYRNENHVREICEILGYRYRSEPEATEGENVGFCETSLNTRKTKVSLLDAIKKVPTAYGTNHGERTYRTCYPCYKDIHDPRSLHFVIIIRPSTPVDEIEQIKELYPPIIIPQEGDY
jgi:hypothetical protein